MNTEKSFYTISELAERYNKSYHTVRKRILEHKLKIEHLKNERTIRIPIETVKKLDKIFQLEEKKTNKKKEQKENVNHKNESATENEQLKSENFFEIPIEIRRRETTMTQEEQLRKDIEDLKINWVAKTKDYDHLIKDLKREQEELRASTESVKNQLSQTTKTIGELNEVLEKVKTGFQQTQQQVAPEQIKNQVSEVISEHVEPLKKQVEEIPKWTPEKIKEMVNECIKDPNSEACQVITQMIAPSKEPMSPLEKHGLEHTTARELLECKECGPLVLKSLREDHPEMLERIICGSNNKECRLKLKLYTEEELQSKLKEAVEKAKKENKGFLGF